MTENDERCFWGVICLEEGSVCVVCVCVCLNCVCVHDMLIEMLIEMLKM